MASNDNNSASNENNTQGKELKEQGNQSAAERLDLQDSASDKERLKGETTNINLPEVKDIPGQEHIISAGIPAEMRDTTISSDDEEGMAGETDLLADEDEDIEIVMGTEADVTKDDLLLLGDPDKDQDMYDDEDLSTAALDDTDFEGDPLNEATGGSSSATGEDLIVPGSEDDDDLEDIGEEDEENNYYSLGSDDNDSTVEGTP